MDSHIHLRWHARFEEAWWSNYHKAEGPQTLIVDMSRTWRWDIDMRMCSSVLLRLPQIASYREAFQLNNISHRSALECSPSQTPASTRKPNKTTWNLTVVEKIPLPKAYKFVFSTLPSLPLLPNNFHSNRTAHDWLSDWLIPNRAV